MADAYVIETSQFTAGIIAAQHKGYRFYASHPTMLQLEGEIFSSPRAAQVAAERLAGDIRTAPSRRWRGG